MTRRLFGRAGFGQVILTSAGNLASSYYFVDMILRRQIMVQALRYVHMQNETGDFVLVPLALPALRPASTLSPLTIERAKHGLLQSDY